MVSFTVSDGQGNRPCQDGCAFYRAADMDGHSIYVGEPEKLFMGAPVALLYECGRWGLTSVDREPASCDAYVIRPDAEQIVCAEELGGGGWRTYGEDGSLIALEVDVRAEALGKESEMAAVFQRWGEQRQCCTQVLLETNLPDWTGAQPCRSGCLLDIHSVAENRSRYRSTAPVFSEHTLWLSHLCGSWALTSNPDQEDSCLAFALLDEDHPAVACAGELGLAKWTFGSQAGEHKADVGISCIESPKVLPNFSSVKVNWQGSEPEVAKTWDRGPLLTGCWDHVVDHGIDDNSRDAEWWRWVCCFAAGQDEVDLLKQSEQMGCWNFAMGLTPFNCCPNSRVYEDSDLAEYVTSRIKEETAEAGSSWSNHGPWQPCPGKRPALAVCLGGVPRTFDEEEVHGNLRRWFLGGLDGRGLVGETPDVFVDFVLSPTPRPETAPDWVHRRRTGAELRNVSGEARRAAVRRAAATLEPVEVTIHADDAGTIEGSAPEWIPGEDVCFRDWRHAYRFGNYERCVHMVRNFEERHGRAYDWVAVVRPDFLFAQPVMPLCRMPSKSVFVSNDFVQLIPRPVAFEHLLRPFSVLRRCRRGDRCCLAEGHRGAEDLLFSRFYCLNLNDATPAHFCRSPEGYTLEWGVFYGVVKRLE
mmetsp:Transcript_18887/g.48052  ORF Transcript_18887/g.48052 Transcript_18887/m.48052 type:complete len:642 (+) Transcript_18887:77-2002(+)